jgi:hypothetical protein
MTSRLLATVLALLCLLSIGLTANVAAQEPDRDRLAQVLMDVPNLVAFPPRILASDDTNTINRLVFEAREFGVPLAIRVISTPTSATTIGGLTSLHGAIPAQQQITQRLADEWLDNETIETSEGAGDGILLLVVIPLDDHTQTTAAFATGPNALPQNGLTRERLDRIVTDVMQPFFADDRVGAGIMEGGATLNYENLFITSPRIQVEGPRENLQTVANLPLAALTVVSVVALLGAIAWISRRNAASGSEFDGTLSPFAAGAIARGRVDAAVTTAAILHLIELGSLIPRTTGLGGLTLALGSEPLHADAFARRVWDTLSDHAEGEPRHLSSSTMRQLQDLLSTPRHTLEDDLAREGLFNRLARVETIGNLLACGGVLAVALYTLTPSILAMARWGVFAIVLALIAIGVALSWTSRRTWSTPTGLRAQRQWAAQHRQHASAERAIYDAIVYQDALLGLQGGREATSPTVHLVRSIRGLGAA